MTIEPRRMEPRNLGDANPVVPRIRSTGREKIGKSAIEMNEDADAWRDQQPCTSSCGLCGWSFNGSAGEARVEFAAHLAAVHPERVGKKRKRNATGWLRDNGQRAAAMPMVEQRAKTARASEDREAAA
jgi:hypothetical protein